MSNYLVSDTDMTSVANAIRAKSGGSSQLAFPAGFVSEIGDIPSGGNLPFGLVKEKTLIDTTFTADSDITANISEVALYTVDPILQADYNNTDFFLIFGYVSWKGSKAVADLSSNQFVSASSIMSFPRTYGANFNGYVNSAYSIARYTSNWTFCANTNNMAGLYLTHKSASATNIVLKLQFSYNSGVVAKAGDYAVKADLYKFNVLQLEGSLP